MSRLPLLLALSLAVLLLGAPAAGAATLDIGPDGALVIDESAGRVEVSEPSAGTLAVATPSAVSDPLPEGCARVEGGARVECKEFTDVAVEGGADADVRLGDGFNVIRTGGGADTIDAGRGNDLVYAGAGDDRVDARDGYADRIHCGEGADVADVDQLDVAAEDCETVNVQPVPNANDEPQDAQPTVRWVSPADNAALSHDANALRVAATDDRAIQRVELYAGTRLVCTVTAAPYECSYTPTDKEVGRPTLVAVAYDSAGQAGVAVRGARLARFRALGFHATLARKPHRRLATRFVTQGHLTLSRAVARAAGCKGRVSLAYEIGSTTIASRSVKLGKRCAFNDRIRPTLAKKLASGRLRVVARFEGNPVMAARSATSNRVRAR